MKAGLGGVRGFLLAGLLWLATLTPAGAGSFGDLSIVTNYCPTQYLQFWDTIVFTLAVDRVTNSRGMPGLVGGTEYDVKIPRDVNSVGHLRNLVAYELNVLGYATETGPVRPSHIGQLVHVSSAVACGIPANLRLPGAGQSGE